MTVRPRPGRPLHAVIVSLTIVATVLAASATLSPPAEAAGGTFSDVGPSHPFRADIQRIALEGITNGCGGGRYCPDDDVTRGEMAAFLVRMLRLPASSVRFDDTRGHRFENDVAALAAAGITRGCNPPANSRFCPDEPVTRAAMATFLTRALDLPRGEPQFSDVDSSNPHDDSIAALAQSRITRGCGGSGARFCPWDEVTRGQMAAFLARSLVHRTREVPAWFATLPTSSSVGQGRTYTGTGDEPYALWTDRSVDGVRATGGDSAAIRTIGPVTVRNSVLTGATDGLKPSDGASLVNSVVSVSYGAGAHADHVQIRGIDGVTLERLRLVAENGRGSVTGGWNAAIFTQEGSTDWTIRHVYIQAGRPQYAIQSWFPVRLYSGTGRVDGLIVDREAMRGSSIVDVTSSTRITLWRDVYIREPNGALTPVPPPVG